MQENSLHKKDTKKDTHKVAAKRKSHFVNEDNNSVSNRSVSKNNNVKKNTIYSKFSSLVYEDKIPEEEKYTLGIKKKDGEFSNSKLYKNNSVIKFVKKSEMKNDSENKDLAYKIKHQFNSIKIKNLIEPEKLIESSQDKFVRNKCDYTLEFQNLNREIEKERFADNKKLALNIFDDFGKQEAWQSYTTLLFAEFKTKS